MFPTSPSIYSVSELSLSLKILLETTYRFITVKGEVSNLKTPYSGHSYFTLKDESAQIRAVLFKNQQRYLAKPLQDGTQIICHGRISLYEPRGEYQIIIDTIEEDGRGALQQQYEKIKNELAEKGYFLEEKKKTIPRFPKNVIVISSATGAAIQDFLKIHSLRTSTTHIQIIPVRVQGAFAAQEIADALQLANSITGTDAIVLCRGGGSIEDLWAFNEVIVAHAIFASTVPVISAVGHETDFTIADFCADLRAATPTGAAEQLLFDPREVREKIALSVLRQKREIDFFITNHQHRITRAIRGLGRIEHSLDKYQLRVQLAAAYLEQAMFERLSLYSADVAALRSRLKEEAPLHKIALQTQQLQDLIRRLYRQIQQNLQDKEIQFSQQAALLNSVSPLATLARGYSVTRKIDPLSGVMKLITASSQAEQGDTLKIQLHQGSLLCEVTEKD